MIYYHCCSYKLEPGSIILPGNWGRMLSKYTPNFQSPFGGWMLAREMIFEESRKILKPTAPSRLECNYVCENLHELENFIISYSRKFDLKYEVELTYPEFETHYGNYKIVSWDNDNNSLDVKAKAATYWLDEPTENREILTTSPLKIIGSID